MKKNKETLSQLMDGEWQDLDSSESVIDICADDGLKETWSRYHLIRDVIRNEDAILDAPLSLRISDAIADEPTYTNVSAIWPNSKDNANAHSISAAIESDNVETTQKPAGKSAVKTGVTGLALAACVAMATVVGLNVWQQGAPDSGAQNVANAPSTVAPGLVVPEVEFVSNKGSYWVSPESNVRSVKSEQRLNALLSNHIEQSPTADRAGMLPYSRLIGYDTVDSSE